MIFQNCIEIGEMKKKLYRDSQYLYLFKCQNISGHVTSLVCESSSVYVQQSSIPKNLISQSVILNIRHNFCIFNFVKIRDPLCVLPSLCNMRDLHADARGGPVSEAMESGARPRGENFSFQSTITYVPWKNLY